MNIKKYAIILFNVFSHEYTIVLNNYLYLYRKLTTNNMENMPELMSSKSCLYIMNRIMEVVKELFKEEDSDFSWKLKEVKNEGLRESKYYFIVTVDGE